MTNNNRNICIIIRKGLNILYCNMNKWTSLIGIIRTCLINSFPQVSKNKIGALNPVEYIIVFSI